MKIYTMYKLECLLFMNIKYSNFKNCCYNKFTMFSLIGILEISLIAVGGLILVLVIAGLGIFFASRKRISSNVKELHRKYDYFHALLIGKCAQSVRRLELISRTNLLYSDTYARFMESFNRLKDKDDVKASHQLKILDDDLGKKDFKSCKVHLLEAKQVISNYETNMLKFDNEINNVLRPEEETHQKALMIKEQLRSVKQDYFSKSVDLALIASSFEHVFNAIDKDFMNVDVAVDGAEYDEANRLLAGIKQTLEALKEALTIAPILVALTTTVLPEKLSEVEQAKERLEAMDVPLNHLMVKSGLNDLHVELADIMRDLKVLKVRGLQEKLNIIENKIDEYGEQFEKEKEAKDSFDARYEELYQIVSNLEKRFMKMCHTLPEIRKIYIINAESENRLEEIKNQINEVGAAKRILDNYVHSSTRQPYTILVAHMNELEAKADEAFESMDAFTHYLASLKTHTEEAYQTIHAIYINLKRGAKKIRDLAIPSIDIYEDEMNKAYSLIKTIDETLKVLPIDVIKVMTSLEELNRLSSRIISEIEKTYNMGVLAETSIVYANRSRQRFNNLNKQLQTFEQRFYAGDFERVYFDTRALLSSLESSEKNKASNA